MYTSYGVVWREGVTPLARGKLELLAGALKLTGIAGVEDVAREIPYGDLAAVHVGRSSADRLNGLASLVVEPVTGERLTLSFVGQPGALGELAQRLAGLIAVSA
ncbi:MAG: hypothetical protein QOG06_2070 [Gaiellaceae bacterium]|jgi:hypothetical protein|nr:hypothetical protein [Gaiellaceae bacterium]